MKKILIATPLYPPDIGGPATYAKALVEGLPAAGIEVSLVRFGDVRHMPKFIRHYVYYQRIVRELRNADAVLALDPVSVGLPAMKAAQKLNKPLLVKIVGDYAWEQGVQRFGVKQNLDEFVKTKQEHFLVKRLRQIQTRVALAASKIIVPSEYLQDVVSAWGVPKENMVVIYNGIHIPADLPQQKKEKEFLVVSAGRRVPWKGFEALESLSKGHAAWDIKVLSEMPREQVLGWIKEADVFVLNSSYEGFPHTLVEAMTLGTPVVVTDTRAHRIVAGEAALYVPVGDTAALEQALQEVHRDPAAAHGRAGLGMERMKNFQLSTMIKRTADLLKSL